MSTLEVALARIAALEARVSALESGAGAPSTSSGGGRPNGGGSSSSSAAEPLPDHFLDNAWADKVITKDPKGWKGRTQINRRYSQAPPEWLLDMAGFFEWKAKKGREEVPVRMNTKGKPWHESDTFEAKILRGWAARNAGRAAAAPPPPPKDDFLNDAADPTSFDFGANVKPKTAPKDDVGF